MHLACTEQRSHSQQSPQKTRVAHLELKTLECLDFRTVLDGCLRANLSPSIVLQRNSDPVYYNRWQQIRTVSRIAKS